MVMPPTNIALNDRVTSLPCEPVCAPKCGRRYARRRPRAVLPRNPRARELTYRLVRLEGATLRRRDGRRTWQSTTDGAGSDIGALNGWSWHIFCRNASL